MNQNYRIFGFYLQIQTAIFVTVPHYSLYSTMFTNLENKHCMFQKKTTKIREKLPKYSFKVKINAKNRWLCFILSTTLQSLNKHIYSSVFCIPTCQHNKFI